MDIHERLRLFLERLQALPPFTTHDQALAEIARVLTGVEDEYSGVPRDPSDMPAVTGGRMYPPHPAYAKRSAIPEVTEYTHTAHRTYIGDNGAVRIVSRKTGDVILEKAGSDGRGTQS